MDTVMEASPDFTLNEEGEETATGLGEPERAALLASLRDEALDAPTSWGSLSRPADPRELSCPEIPTAPVPETKLHALRKSLEPRVIPAWAGDELADPEGSFDDALDRTASLEGPPEALVAPVAPSPELEEPDLPDLSDRSRSWASYVSDSSVGTVTRGQSPTLAFSHPGAAVRDPAPAAPRLKPRPDREVSQTTDPGRDFVGTKGGCLLHSGEASSEALDAPKGASGPRGPRGDRVAPARAATAFGELVDEEDGADRTVGLVAPSRLDLDETVGLEGIPEEEAVFTPLAHALDGLLHSPGISTPRSAATSGSFPLRGEEESSPELGETRLGVLANERTDDFREGSLGPLHRRPIRGDARYGPSRGGVSAGVEVEGAGALIDRGLHPRPGERRALDPAEAQDGNETVDELEDDPSGLLGSVLGGPGSQLRPGPWGGGLGPSSSTGWSDRSSAWPSLDAHVSAPWAASAPGFADDPVDDPTAASDRDSMASVRRPLERLVSQSFELELEPPGVVGALDARGGRLSKEPGRGWPSARTEDRNSDGKLAGTSPSWAEGDLGSFDSSDLARPSALDAHRASLRRVVERIRPARERNRAQHVETRSFLAPERVSRAEAPPVEAAPSRPLLGWPRPDPDRERGPGRGLLVAALALAACGIAVGLTILGTQRSGARSELELRAGDVAQGPGHDEGALAPLPAESRGPASSPTPALPHHMAGRAGPGLGPAKALGPGRDEVGEVRQAPHAPRSAAEKGPTGAASTARPGAESFGASAPTAAPRTAPSGAERSGASAPTGAGSPALPAAASFGASAAFGARPTSERAPQRSEPAEVTGPGDRSLGLPGSVHRERAADSASAAGTEALGSEARMLEAKAPAPRVDPPVPEGRRGMSASAALDDRKPSRVEPDEEAPRRTARPARERDAHRRGKGAASAGRDRVRTSGPSRARPTRASRSGLLALECSSPVDMHIRGLGRFRVGPGGFDKALAPGGYIVTLVRDGRVLDRRTIRLLSGATVELTCP